MDELQFEEPVLSEEAAALNEIRQQPDCIQNTYKFGEDKFGVVNYIEEVSVSLGKKATTYFYYEPLRNDGGELIGMQTKDSKTEITNL